MSRKLTLCVVGLVLAAAGAGIDLTEWKWRCRIRPERAAEDGLIEFSVPPAVFDGARRDLADLRVLAGNEVIPWVVRRPRGSRRSVRVRGKVYNRTHLPGKLSRATVDFGDRVMKDRVHVASAGEDFKREVRIEASQDASDWQVLRAGAFLFDVSGGPGDGFRKDVVSLPENDFRYLRLTIYHDPGDPAEVAIRDVWATRQEGEAAELTDVPVSETGVTQEGEDSVTEIELDLGYGNLPLHALRLEFADLNFYRHVSLAGRNRTTRRVTQRLEGGGERERRVEEPWRGIGSGHIYRYTAGGPPDESLTLGLKGARYRYLRVRVDNGADEPLEFLRATADRYLTYLAFPPRRRGPFWLYGGYPGAGRPQHDLPHYAGRLRSEGVTGAAVGGLRSVRVEKSREVRFSERFRRVLWIVLVGAVVVLGWLVWRQVKAARELPR